MVWQTKKLEELVDFTGGLWTGKKAPFQTVKVLRNTNFQSSGLINYDNVAEISAESKQVKVRILEPGDILLEKSGGGPDQPVGRVVYFDENGQYSFSNFTCRLRIKNFNEIDTKFLWLFLYDLYLSGVTEKMQKQTTGIRNLTMSEYKNLQISFPNIEEQRGIVERIEASFQKIKQIEELQRQSVVDSAAIMASSLNNILSQKRWNKETIGNLATDIKSGFACGKYNEIFNGVVHLRTHNIGLDGKLNLTKIIRIPEKMADTTLFNLKKDDIIFNNTNSVELVGKTAIIRENLPYTFSNHLTRIRFRNDLIMPEWVLFIFQKYWRDKYFENICTRWVGQAGINQTNLAKISIPLPTLAEQQRIVIYLNSILKKSSNVQNLQNEIDIELYELRLSILNRAFIPNQQSGFVLPKTNIFSTQQAIGLILKNRFERGEMVIAKILYLAQEIYKVPLGIQFSPQNFGPYDQQVKKAITAGLSSSNKFFRKKKIKQFSVYALDSGSQKLFTYSNSKVLKEMDNALKFLLPMISNAQSAAIELLATVCKAIQDTKSTDEVIIQKYISDWKPNKFTNEQIKKIIQFIHSKKWNEALLLPRS